MRRENLMITGCIMSSILIAGLGIRYKQQLNYIKCINTQQQSQISSLRESNSRLEDTNVLLKRELKIAQEQLDTIKLQMNELVSNGGWSMHKGIATAYSPLDNRNGIEADADGHHTSIGLHPGNGIIAVDPKRIPYNSKLIIIYPNGTIYEGIAGDTGGALRNDDEYHVDIYKDTFDEAEKHGVQKVIILWKPQ